MRHADSLIFVSNAKCKRRLIFDYQFALLQPGDSGTDTVQLLAIDSEFYQNVTSYFAPRGLY